MQAAMRTTLGGFSARIASFLETVEIKALEDEEEKEAVYRLRYDAYLRAGSIHRNFTKTLTDGFDDDANAWLFGIYVDNILASSIRIHVATPAFPRSPALFAFRDVLMPEIEKGAVIVDPSRFVAEGEATQRYPELPYATVRLGFLACEFFNADLGLATVRAEHQAFYKRLFGLSLICGPRTYPSILRPLSLLAARFPEVREENLRRSPFLAARPEELRTLFGGRQAGLVGPRYVREPAVAPPRATSVRPQRDQAARRPANRPAGRQADKGSSRSRDSDS